LEKLLQAPAGAQARLAPHRPPAGLQDQPPPGLPGRRIARPVVQEGPQMDLAGACMAAERLRLGLERSPVRLAGGFAVRITASFGVASRDELATSESGDVLVTLADRRLYQAKAAGRNLVRP